MKHLALPEEDQTPPTTLPPDESQPAAAPANAGKRSILARENVERTTRVVPEGHHCYVIKVVSTEPLGGGYVGAWIFLTHRARYSQQQIDQMVAECTAFIRDTRIPKRVEETAKQRIPITDPAAMNVTLFEQDAEFLEAMLIDKYEFRKLMYIAAEGHIVPTIKGVG